MTKGLIHEWDYVIYLFGIPDMVTHIKDRISNLEIDCDDISIYGAIFGDAFIDALDYFGHKKERMLQSLQTIKG